MINVNNNFYIRWEQNGITVYEKKNNLYKFYEGLDFEYIKEISSDEKKLIKYLEKNKKLISRNLNFTRPLRLNWLVEEKCNLGCIYCFANDKMKNNESKESIIDTVNQILKYEVLNVGISGGEPTLNPYLGLILDKLKGKCSINIDTNGTLPSLGNMVDKLKSADVLVRITIDSVRYDILDKLRPAKIKKTPHYLETIYNNVKILVENDINLMIHTVVTQYNKDYLEEIAEKLIELGVKRWHLYGVNYSDRCKDFYDEIKITKEELLLIKKKLLAKYGDKICITFYFNEGTYSANSVLLIDSKGRLYLDSIFNGIHYIGHNPKKPSLDEIKDSIDVKLHHLGYLWVNDDND